MVNIRKFVVSDDTFGGYSQMVDIDEVESLADIIGIVRRGLARGLADLGLTVLSSKVTDANFHIHSISFEDILMSETNETYYVCGHC